MSQESTWIICTHIIALEMALTVLNNHIHLNTISHNSLNEPLTDPNSKYESCSFGTWTPNRRIYSPVDQFFSHIMHLIAKGDSIISASGKRLFHICDGALQSCEVLFHGSDIRRNLGFKKQVVQA